MKRDIREVARRANVSVGTVSNVLNNPDRVSEATRERVRSVIAEVGYVRNESARQLREGHSRTIGLVVLDVANPFFADVIIGVEDVAYSRGSVVAVANSADRKEREHRHLEIFLEQRVQGLLITPIDSGDRGSNGGQLHQFTERGIPLVLVDRRSDDGSMCAVAVDDVAGGRMAGTHLVDTGRRHVAFLGGPPRLPQVEDRLTGLRQALATVDLEPTVVDTGSLTLKGGYDGIARLLDDHPETDAVFAANDLVALGALRRLVELNIEVPDDIAMVGYDDIAFARAAATPLTSVRQPRELLGRTAAELLFEELSDDVDHVHRTVEYTPELVVRASSAAR